MDPLLRTALMGATIGIVGVTLKLFFDWLRERKPKQPGIGDTRHPARSFQKRQD